MMVWFVGWVCWCVFSTICVCWTGTLRLAGRRRHRVEINLQCTHERCSAQEFFIAFASRKCSHSQ